MLSKQASEIVDKIVELIENLNDCSSSEEFAEAREYICDELHEYN